MCPLRVYCQYRQTSPTCLGRNKSSIVTIAMDLALHGGGDYHTTYWPQASYLSSRKYYIGTQSAVQSTPCVIKYSQESTFSGYQELDFSQGDRNTIYWHYTVPELGVAGAECAECHISILIKPSLMEIVQVMLGCA